MKKLVKVQRDSLTKLCYRRNAEPEELQIPNDSDQIFTSLYFNSSNPIKVVTHGWLSKMNETWLQDMKNEFLINNDYNVIIIDWNELSKNIIYPWAAFSTRYVGKKTARLLDSIAKAYDINGSSIHLTGHSLGAQVMAHTANFFNYSLNRITGKNYFTLSYKLHCRQCIFDVIFSLLSFFFICVTLFFK